MISQHDGREGGLDMEPELQNGDLPHKASHCAYDVIVNTVSSSSCATLPPKERHSMSTQQTTRLCSTPVWLILLIVLLTASLASAQYTYQSIDVPLTGARNTRIHGLTDLGTMAGIYDDANGVQRNWMYRQGKQRFDPVIQPGQQLYIQDINGDLRMVGNALPKGQGKHQNGFMKKESVFVRIFGPNGEPTQNCAMNQASLVACEYDDIHAGSSIVLWNAKAKSNENPVVGAFTIPGVARLHVGGINGHGDVVGSAFTVEDDQERGFIHWGDPSAHGGQAFVLVDAPCGGEDNDTLVQDINDAGVMAVVCIDDWAYSYAYDGVTWTRLAVPGAWDTIVTRVNNPGQFAGWYTEFETELSHGFIATPITPAVAAQ
jgi:hypothetical protein